MERLKPDADRGRVDGILVVDKPDGMTSRRATDRVRHLLQEKKAGHLGTLDPSATGVLPVALGAATRLIHFLEGEEKIYRGVVRLGETTDTQDAAGKIIASGDCAGLDPARILEAARAFVGELEQVPPMFSALKREGQPLYKLARAGIEVERAPRRVTIKSLVVERIEPPDVTLTVTCSPGTYMRALAHDLGQQLGCGAHLRALVRLANGPFTLERAVTLPDLTPEAARAALIPLLDCLPTFPQLEIGSRETEAIGDGLSIPAPLEAAALTPGAFCRLVQEGELIAVAVVADDGPGLVLRPKRVFKKPGT